MVYNGTFSETNNLSAKLQSQGSLHVQMTPEETLDANLSNEVLRGYSAYQVAVQNGFKGTEQEWLNSLKDEVIVAVPIAIDDGDGNISIRAKQVNGDEPISTDDYDELKDKPSINGVELSGNKTFEELGLIGHGLKFNEESQQLEINMAEEVEKDNTLPISSADVYTVVGNIGVLLETI